MSKVLYITYNDAFGHLGQSQVIPYLRGLLDKGHSFTLLSYERNMGHGEKNHFSKKVGIKWIPLQYHKYPTLPATAFDILNGIVKSIRVIKKENIEIIHARSYVPALIGLVAKKITGTKLIFDMRGFMADENAEGGSWSKTSFKYKLSKYFEKKLLNGSDSIITLTHAAKEILQNQFLIEKDISVIPCCVDSEKFILGKYCNAAAKLRTQLFINDRLVVVYSGSLGGWYMSREMGEFYVEAKKHKKDLFFLILSNSPKGMIEDVFKENGISQGDYSILNIKPEDMPLYLSVADFALAFIKPCFSKKASSPIKFGEYLAMGLPIVTNSGIGDSDSMITSDVGVVVNDFTGSEYKRATQQILLILKNGQETKEACEETVKKYLSLDMGVEKYNKIYSHLNIE